MKKEPNRFRALYHGVHAASLGGDAATSRRYFTELVAMCAKADATGRPELTEARTRSNR